MDILDTVIRNSSFDVDKSLFNLTVGGKAPDSFTECWAVKHLTKLGILEQVGEAPVFQYRTWKRTKPAFFYFRVWTWQLAIFSLGARITLLRLIFRVQWWLRHGS